MAKIVWKDQAAIDQEKYQAQVQSIKQQRDKLLTECDWIVLRHRDEQENGLPTTLTTEQYQEWLDYRQALRGLPNSEGFDPFNVVWPPPPTLN